MHVSFFIYLLFYIKKVELKQGKHMYDNSGKSIKTDLYKYLTIS